MCFLLTPPVGPLPPAQYDNSTIPIIFHPTWFDNYAHVATSGLAWVYNNINRSTVAAISERARWEQWLPGSRSPGCQAVSHAAELSPCDSLRAWSLNLTPCVQAGDSHATWLGHASFLPAAVAAPAAPADDHVC